MHAHLSTKSQVFAHNENWIKNVGYPHLHLIQQKFTIVSTYVIGFKKSQNRITWKGHSKVI